MPSSTPPPRDLKALAETAHELADLSAKAILPQFRRSIAVENKAGAGGFDPVTAADKAAERVIRKHLKATHPEHGVLGEEYGAAVGSSPYTWVIDPIDGTKAFITGTPLWGTLIGLSYADRAVLGVMNQPFTGERVFAAGQGAHWSLPGGRSKRIKTRACPKLDDAMLGTTSPDLLSAIELDAFVGLKRRARLTRYGGDCYGYCLLAAGHFDLIVECGLKPHDVMALIPIIEAAGGVITTWDGGRPEGGGRIVAAGDPRLHEAVLKTLSKVRG